jgi:hypothetical protein
MKGTLFAAGVIFNLVGAVWILQGLDIAIAPQSFMTGSGWWVFLGAVTFLIGDLMIIRAVKSRDR